MAHGRSLREFGEYREKMNRKILERGKLQTKRFFNLDTQAYNDGALPRKTKELLGLVASMVLRCDDCVTYPHHTMCRAEGYGPGVLRSVQHRIGGWGLDSDSAFAACCGDA